MYLETSKFEQFKVGLTIISMRNLKLEYSLTLVN